MKIAFFDRDGVVNIDRNYVYKKEDFAFQEGFISFFKSIISLNFVPFIVTNQSGIARGYYTLKDFINISIYMQEELKKSSGYNFKRIYFCPHESHANCNCRKPKAGMILRIKEDFNVEGLEHSFLIGDKLSDLEAAKNAGVGRQFLFPKMSFKEIEEVLKNG